MKLSVLMISYNHEKYIQQAIESVLAQRTNFPFEIVLGEDCSSDRTGQIAADYASRYPETIRLLDSNVNLGMHRNFLRTYDACKGEYVAILEGDDYWTSVEKLQAQVDFLDTYRDCVLCMHPVSCFDDEKNRVTRRFYPHFYQQFCSFEELLRGNFIPTCSAMFRRSPSSVMPEWVFSLKMLDWPFFILLTQRSKIGMINQVMGTYRLHAGGLWSSQRAIVQVRETIRMYEFLSVHFEHRYDRIIIPMVKQMNRMVESRWRWYILERVRKIPFLNEKLLPVFEGWRWQLSRLLARWK